MPVGLSGWFAFAILVLTLAAIAAGAAAVYRANLAKGQLEYLERDVKLRDNRIDILEQDNTRMSNELTLEKQRVASLTDKVRVLETVVTGKEQLDHLQQSLDNVVAQVFEDHREIQRNQSRIQDKLNEVLRLLKEDAA